MIPVSRRRPGGSKRLGRKLVTALWRGGRCGGEEVCFSFATRIYG